MVAPDKEKRTLTLPTPLWEDIERLAELSGTTAGEMARFCMELGVLERKELMCKSLSFQTKLGVIQKLRQRQGAMESALDRLAEKAYPENLELIDELKGYLKD